MKKALWGLSAVVAVAIVIVVMFWQLTPEQRQQTTVPPQTKALEVLATTAVTTPTPAPTSTVTTDIPQTLFIRAHQLLALAQQGDASAQYKLADLLRFCDGISKNGRYFADDANYYLATANDADSTFFTGLKQAVTDCAEFNQQNMQDFHIEEPGIEAADYWLARAVMQHHPQALQQALAYFPQALQQNKTALAMLDQQLATAQSETLFQLGVCLTMQGAKTQAGPLLSLACQQGKNCTASNIEPIQLPYLVHCSALQRTEEINEDGSIFNAQRSCYQHASLLDISRLMLPDQQAEAITAQQQKLKKQLQSGVYHETLLQQCVSP